MIPQAKMTGKRAVWFILLTFALTYAMWGFLALNPGGRFPFGSPQAMIPFILGALSPAIIMFVLIKKWGKTKEERAFFRPIFHTAHGWKSAVLVSLIFFAVFLGILRLFAQQIEPWYMLAAVFPMMIIGGGLEEIGWRGFLQPALEKKMPFWLVAIVVGVIWGVWHLPLRFVPGTFQDEISFLLYIGFTILMSFLLGAIKRLTGSVAASIAFHAWTNVVLSVFSVTSLLDGSDSPVSFAFCLLGFAAAATAAVSIFRRHNDDSKP